MKKSSRVLKLAGTLIILALVAGTGAYALTSLRTSCEVKAVERASSMLLTQLKRYDQIYQVATSAPPTSIVRPVTMMQLILMDTRDFTVPGCMQTAQDELVQYMGTVIQAFLAYQAGEAEATIRDLVDESDAHYDKFATEIETVRACAPLCLR